MQDQITLEINRKLAERSLLQQKRNVQASKVAAMDRELKALDVEIGHLYQERAGQMRIFND